MSFALAVTLSVTGCQPPAPPEAVLAGDVTASTATRLDEIAAELQRDGIEVLNANRGLGAWVTVASMGGGPADVRTTRLNVLCTRGSRQCLDKANIDGRAAQVNTQIAALMSQPPAVGGSDPIASIVRLLRDVPRRRGPLTAYVVTDMASRSDTLDVTTVDLSSPDARGKVIAELRARGFDPSTLGLTKRDRIVVRLVPTDVAGVAAAYFEYLAAFTREFLATSGAQVEVTLQSSITTKGTGS